MRGVPEDVVGEIGEGEKGGCGGKRGWNMRGVTGGQWSGKGKIAKSGKQLMRRLFGVQKELQHSRSGALIEARGRSFPEPLCQKGRFLAAVVLKRLWAESGIFEDQGAAISERDFFGLPSGGLVELVGRRLGSGPRLVVWWRLER